MDYCRDFIGKLESNIVAEFLTEATIKREPSIPELMDELDLTPGELLDGLGTLVEEGILMGPPYRLSFMYLDQYFTGKGDADPGLEKLDLKPY